MGNKWLFRGCLAGVGLVTAISCGGSGSSGTTPAAPTRTIALSGNLAYGDVPIGSTAVATFSVSNAGSETLAVSGVTYPEGFTGNWASGQIAAGGSQTVTVAFAPTAPQIYSGKVTVSSAATSGTNTIDVSGTGSLRPRDWTMTGILKDWLITPHDLAINGREIYVTGNLDNRVAVVGLDGHILRYYTLEKNLQFDNICVAVTSGGQVVAMSSRGIWELRPDGTTGVITRFTLAGVDHLTIGPDDKLYLSTKSQGRSRILAVGLNGATTDFLTVDSDRVSDLEFDSRGNLFIADGQHGRILRYVPGQSVQTFSTGFSDPSGGGPFYLAFDRGGTLYASSSVTGLAVVSGAGVVTRLELNNVSGDLFFSDGLLYTLDIYTSKLFEINLHGTTVFSTRILLGGAVPWYIDHWGDIIVGNRATFTRREFFNYDITRPGRVEPNPSLNALQPDHYTFDDAGNMYYTRGRVFRKVDSTGREQYNVSLPGNLDRKTRLSHSPSDDMIYYFDIGSNSVIRVDGHGAETHHRFVTPVSSAFLSVTKQGRIYAAIVAPDGARLVDISESPSERIVWRPNGQFSVYWFHIACDARGNLYAALGPSFQHVVWIDPAKGTTASVLDASTSRFDWGFVDPQGFVVTDSGAVVVSAPGVLLAFVPVV